MVYEATHGAVGGPTPFRTLKDGSKVKEVKREDLKPDQRRWWIWDIADRRDRPTMAAQFHCHGESDPAHPETAWVLVESEDTSESKFDTSDVNPILTTDKAARKEMPIARGVLDYFPLAIAEVAHVSFKANEQHNPGQPMHWARGKSTDHQDCIARHLIERGGIDDDGLRHSAKLAWRALALLQEELEKAKGAKPGDVR